MTTTDDVITSILTAEGWPAVTDRQADRGGLTKGGITLMALARFTGGRVVAQDLIDLDEATARALYLKSYVFDPGFDTIRDPFLQAFIVDYAVNSGRLHVVADLQRTLGVSVDGVFGAVTIAATNAADPHALLVAMLKSRSVFVHHLALHDSDVLTFLDTHPTSQLHNLNGWNNRVLNFVH